MNFVFQKCSTRQAQMSAWYFNSITVLYVKQKWVVIFHFKKEIEEVQSCWLERITFLL
jgi:hypothetical protein